MKNALVTGGAGFIGSNLVSLLLKNQYNVVVLDNFSSGKIENLNNLKVKIIKSDLINIQNLEFDIKFDVVFHLAASVGRQKSIEFPLIDANSNIISTIELLNRKNDTCIF